MKKIFTFLVVLQFITSGIAQNLPNNGFETWTNATTPTNWAVNYNGTVNGIIPLTFSFGTRTVDAHSGTYALKISPTLMSVGNITMPGFVQLGSVGTFNLDLATLTALANLDFSNIDLDSLAGLQALISKGVPMTNSPSEVKFWYKFLPDGTDEASINVITTKWNSLTNTPEVVASGNTTISDLVNQYSEMNVMMSKNGSSSVCDTIRVIIVAGGAQASAATEFFIDDITLKFNTWSVELNPNATFKMYPNPTTNDVVLSLNDYATPYDVEVYDIYGKLVLNRKNISEAYTFSTTSLSSGVYLVKTIQKGIISSSKLIVE